MRYEQSTPGPDSLHVLQRGEGQSGVRLESERKIAADTGHAPEQRLLCSLCGFTITTMKMKIRIQDSHVHTFANPYGYLYRIGCFLAAPGCRVDPAESTDFTWFSGYAWSIEVCGRCHTHMGWRFRSGSSCFHGLVLDRLSEERGSPAADG